MFLHGLLSFRTTPECPLTTHLGRSPVCEAARLVFKHAMHKGAAKEDLTAIVKYIERDAGFEMPKTR